MPRNSNGGWNEVFFDNIRSKFGDIFSVHDSDALWLHSGALRRKFFGNSEINPQSLILLFEFEIMNSAFCSIGGEVFKKLSFLDIETREGWLTYDAILLAPSCKLFVFIEAKYLRDIGGGPQGAPFNDQLIGVAEL
ncbi:hypothetical protein ACFL6S_24715 [Candidatus Poribacteria bacterium]